MLLIDHDDAKRIELHGVLDERMGADDQIDLTNQEFIEDSFPISRAGAVCQEIDLERPIAQQRRRVGHLEPLEQASDTGVVLLGQHFGRSHQSGLMAAIDRGQHCGHCYEGLSGANITLE